MEQAPTPSHSTEEIKESPEKGLRERFDRLFEKPEMVKLREAEFELFDLQPEILKDKIPVLFVPGFGKSPRSYKDALFELYNSGRRILAVTAPTGDITLTKEEQGRFPRAQATRAFALMHALQEKGVLKADVVAHSEGGMNAAIAAAQMPDNFRHFVFVALPGVTDEQSYFEIAKRGIQNQLYTKNEMKGADTTQKLSFEQSEADIKKWIKERGALKATIESMNPGRVDIADEVRILHESGHGVSIVSGVEDRMLPIEEYQRDDEGVPRSAEDLGVDGFYSIIKGHGEMEVNGEVGYLTAHALEALAQKYQKNKENFEESQ